MRERVIEVLTILAECQTQDKDHFGCSAITAKIGGTNAHNMVEHDVVYIVDAPEIVINTLASKGFHMSMTSQGLRIDCSR